MNYELWFLSLPKGELRFLMPNAYNLQPQTYFTPPISFLIRGESAITATPAIKA
jgi:hypothetical protein